MSHMRNNLLYDFKAARYRSPRGPAPRAAAPVSAPLRPGPPARTTVASPLRKNSSWPGPAGSAALGSHHGAGP